MKGGSYTKTQIEFDVYFILNGFLKGIKMIKKYSKREMVLNAPVPSFFKALVLEASVRKSVETPEGTYYYDYGYAGYELARHIGNYVNESALCELKKIWNKPLLIRKWLKKYANNFYRTISSKRKEIFINGFAQYLDEHGV